MADTTENVFINYDSNISEYDKEVKDTTKSTADLTKETDEATDQQEEYDKQLIKSAKDVKIFGVSLNSLSAGFKSAGAAIRIGVKSLKSFRIALAATGIGLILIALASLGAILARTQKGINLFNDVLAVLGITIDVLLGTLQKFGEALIKLFQGDIRGAIKLGTEAITGFTDRLTDAVTETLFSYPVDFILSFYQSIPLCVCYFT